MASISPSIHNLDAALISTWRPFRLTPQIWTPHQLSHGVHSALNPQSGRYTNAHMASIPPHIPNLDATHISTWRPFHRKSQIWTPPTPAHGVHSALNPQSGRHPNSHMASIPPHIPNLDAASSPHWRPFRLIPQIWTPPQLSHGVHSTSHPKSGRRPHQHMASIPPQISNLDAAQTPHRCRTDAARGAYIFQKIPLSDIKMHNFILVLKSDENYCTMALTTI